MPFLSNTVTYTEEMCSRTSGWKVSAPTPLAPHTHIHERPLNRLKLKLTASISLFTQCLQVNNNYTITRKKLFEPVQTEQFRWRAGPPSGPGPSGFSPTAPLLLGGPGRSFWICTVLCCTGTSHEPVICLGLSAPIWLHRELCFSKCSVVRDMPRSTDRVCEVVYGVPECLQ